MVTAAFERTKREFTLKLSTSVKSLGKELLAGMVERLILGGIVVLLTRRLVRLGGWRALSCSWLLAHGDTWQQAITAARLEATASWQRLVVAAAGL